MRSWRLEEVGARTPRSRSLKVKVIMGLTELDSGTSAWLTKLTAATTGNLSNLLCAGLPVVKLASAQLRGRETQNQITENKTTDDSWVSLRELNHAKNVF